MHFLVSLKVQLHAPSACVAVGLYRIRMLQGLSRLCRLPGRQLHL